MPTRAFPPDWCNAETAAYLLSMGVSTFREKVERNLLPQPVHIEGKTLWNRSELNDAIFALRDGVSPSPAEHDPIMEAARGKAKETQREAA